MLGRRLPALAVILGWASVAGAQNLPQNVDWKGAQPGFLYFRYRVLPLMRIQCGSLECHGGFTGGRLHLAPPLETGEYSNQAALASYNSAIPLVNAENREMSLMMLKPLRADSLPRGAAVIPHAGPKSVTPRAAPDDPARDMYNALLDWVKGRRVSNFNPIAHAGRNRVVPEAADVILDGSLSFDPNPEDQKRLRYEWKMITKPTGSQATLKAPSKPHPSFTADKPGTYIIRLITNDRRRDSEPSFVTISAQGAAEQRELTAMSVRTSERHDIGAGQMRIVGAVKAVDDADAPGKKALHVEEKTKKPGEASFSVDVKRGGKYGLWMIVKDKQKEEEAIKGPVAITLNNRQIAVLPVPADNESWRILQYSTTQPMRASDDKAAGNDGPIAGLAGGVWTKMMGSWEETKEANRLLATGTGFGAAGRNLADLSVNAEGGMVISATIKATDKQTVRNGYIIWDYKNPTDFKMAGVTLNVQNERFEMDWISPKARNFRETEPAPLEPNVDYNLRLELDEKKATLYFQGRRILSKEFPEAFTGKIGLCSLNAATEFDNVLIWRNQQLVYTNGFGDEPVLGDESGQGDDPTKRLRRRKLLTFRLPTGQHEFKMSMFAGAPDISTAIVARLDTLADVPVPARKLVRSLYVDILGRGPTEEELARDHAKAPAQLIKELTATQEFWSWIYEQELFHLELTDNYRPIYEEDLEYHPKGDFHYNALPAELFNRKITFFDAYRALLTGVYYHARNYGDEDYPRGLWRTLYDREILDFPEEFDAARMMYSEGKAADSGEAPPEVDPKTKKKVVKKKDAPKPKEWKLFGQTGKDRGDLIRITLEQPVFVENLVRRLYIRYNGEEPTDKEVKDGAARLRAGWASKREVLPELVASWLLTPAYMARASNLRRKNDAAFIRTLYVDMFNRAPEFGEFWGAYRIIRSLADNEPMRSIVAAMMIESEEIDIPLKAEIVRTEWIREQVLKLYCREPKPGELTGMDDILKTPDCTTKLFLRALVTHPEYQLY